MSKLEGEHVKDVYEQIAGHFSETRYKAWPVVDRFFKSLPSRAVGLDVGCGNGKNMLVRSDVKCVGFDLYRELTLKHYYLNIRCWNLLEVVKERGLEAVYGNMLSLPFRDSSFDFVISIAAIHHLASEERRKDSLQEMARVIKPPGLIFVFAWALEQPETSALYRHPLKYLEEGNKQDVLVPWTNKSDGTVHHRYYHLFRKGELDELVDSSVDLEVVESGYDKDNWYVIYKRH